MKNLLVVGEANPHCPETLWLGFNVLCYGDKNEDSLSGGLEERDPGSGSDRAGIFLGVREKVESQRWKGFGARKAGPGQRSRRDLGHELGVQGAGAGGTEESEMMGSKRVRIRL